MAAEHPAAQTQRAISPSELREYADLLVHRGEDGSMEERLLREAADELEHAKREVAAVYDELNKALGEHAPKAWDRIKARLSRVY